MSFHQSATAGEEGASSERAFALPKAGENQVEQARPATATTNKRKTRRRRPPPPPPPPHPREAVEQIKTWARRIASRAKGMRRKKKSALAHRQREENTHTHQKEASGDVRGIRCVRETVAAKSQGDAPSQMRHGFCMLEAIPFTILFFCSLARALTSPSLCVMEAKKSKSRRGSGCARASSLRASG